MVEQRLHQRRTQQGQITGHQQHRSWCRLAGDRSPVTDIDQAIPNRSQQPRSGLAVSELPDAPKPQQHVLRQLITANNHHFCSGSRNRGGYPAQQGLTADLAGGLPARRPRRPEPPRRTASENDRRRLIKRG